MALVGEVPLTWRHEVLDGLPVLTVSGTLTTASSELLYESTHGFLRRHRPEVLIDLSALVVAEKDAVSVFAQVVAEALQYPDVLVVVCAPTVEVKRALGRAVLDARLVFDSVAAGRSAALVTVPAVTEDLLPVQGAARHARDVITDACLRWDEHDLIGSAALVATELVSNAATHARTMMTMQVRLRPCHVRIAVSDGSEAPAVVQPPGPGHGGGRGLRLVAAVSAAWGSTPQRGGKVVWSALAREGR